MTVARRAGGLSIPEYRQIESERADAQPLKTSCLLCKWSYTGLAAEGREKALEHRLRKHPQAVATKRPTKNVGQLLRFGSPNMTDEDRAVIEFERQKRAKLTGVQLED